jgi:hypothetical protein
MNALSAPEDKFNESEGFKALVNRTGTVISDESHRRLNRLSKDQPTAYVAVVRNLATLTAMKDMIGIVNRLDVGVLTGIQNQPTKEYLTDRQIQQYRLSIATLRAELESISKQIDLDQVRASLIPLGK